MQYVVLLTVFFFARGFNAFFVKKAQGADGSLKGALIFTSIFSLFQLMTLPLLPPWEWKAVPFEFLVWPLGYAVFFILAYVFLFRAMECGPAGVSNAVFSFYIIVPILAGVFLWEETISGMKIAGLLLFAASVFLFHKSPSPGKGRTVSVKWLVSILLATACSGIGVIFTRECGRYYPGFDKEYLMFYNLFVVLAGLPVLYMCRKRLGVYFNRKNIGNTFGAALTQNANNLIFILYLNRVESALFLPVIGILNILSVVAMGWILLKEKISRYTVAAVGVSLVALFILNL